MSNVFLFCNTTSVLHIIPSVLAKRGRDGVWHGFLLISSHRRLVSFLSSLINSLLPQACLAEGKFFVCDQISPIPDGKLLLNYIRNVSFTSKRSLPFNLSDIVNPNLVFVTTQQSQYSEDCTRLCHRNTENNSLRLHLSGAAIQFSSIYTFEEHYVQQQIILICNKRRLLLVTGCPTIHPGHESCWTEACNLICKDWEQRLQTTGTWYNSSADGELGKIRLTFECNHLVLV